MFPFFASGFVGSHYVRVKEYKGELCRSTLSHLGFNWDILALEKLEIIEAIFLVIV